MTLLTWAVVAAGAATAYLLYQRQISRVPDRLPLPPGPKPLPLLGNILNFPPGDAPEFYHWLKHKDAYGPISSVSAMGVTLVLLHGRQAAHDILAGAHAAKTSGRPHMVFANDFVGFGRFVMPRGYDDIFRRGRKMLHQEVASPAATAGFEGTQTAEARRLLVRALNDPGNWDQHCKTAIVAIILTVGYGYTVEPTKQDPLTTVNENMINAFTVAATPMTWLPDIFPILSHLPRNLPLPFLKAARKLRHDVDTAVFTPYRFVREQMAKGTERPSFVSNLIRQNLQDPEELDSMCPQDERDIIFTAVSLYAGGADTVAISLTAFTMAMAIYPEVQRKAQAELDAVTGGDRLPTFEDRSQLPYLNALIKELHRWWPVSTLGVPHLADEDIEYDGYLIPKGAYIIPGVWSFLHDPESYPDPEVFEPARFLPPRNEPDPIQDAFGYGRRACPGRMFAEANLFAAIAHTLAVFDIRKALDDEGREIDIKPKYRQGVLGYAEPFDVRVTPRSERHTELVRRFEKENPLESGDSVNLKMVSSWRSH